MLALSVDIGGTHIGCAVVRDREILAFSSLESEGSESLASLLASIAETMRCLLAEAQSGAAECQGVAIGFPGIVDARTGRIFSTLKKYEDAVHLDLPGWSRETFGVPLRIENDARMALLGEQYAGAAQGVHDVVMMTLGTGIGGAAMILGKLLRGAHSQAACLGGHLPVDFRGRPLAAQKPRRRDGRCRELSGAGRAWRAVRCCRLQGSTFARYLQPQRRATA